MNAVSCLLVGPRRAALGARQPRPVGGAADSERARRDADGRGDRSRDRRRVCAGVDRARLGRVARADDRGRPRHVQLVRRPARVDPRHRCIDDGSVFITDSVDAFTRPQFTTHRSGAARGGHERGRAGARHRRSSRTAAHGRRRLSDGRRRPHGLLAVERHERREPPLSDIADDARPTADRSMLDPERQTATTAVRAMGYHPDAGADATLDQIAADHADSIGSPPGRQHAGATRGAHGVGHARPHTGATERDAGRAPQPRDVARSNRATPRPRARCARSRAMRTAKIRSEAAYYFVQRGGAAVIPEAVQADRRRIPTTPSADGSSRRSAGCPATPACRRCIQLART